MIAKFVQNADSIDYTPTEAVAAGDVVVIDSGTINGEIVGVAKLDIPAGTLGAIALTGVFEFEKNEHDIKAGQIVYWDATNKQVSNEKADNVYLGKAVADAKTNGPALVLLNASSNARIL